MVRMSKTRQVRLLAVDVDGTLLTDACQISPATSRAVQHVIQRGVQVVLASARGPSALRGIMMELGMSSLAICYTGALTCRISSHPPLEVITEQRIPLPSAHDLLRRALNEEISVGWFAGEAWFIPGWDAILQRESEMVGVVPLVDADLLQRGEAPHKLQCMVGEPARVPLLAALARTLPQDCVGQFSQATYLEITHQQVNKATALLALGHQLGIAPSEMVAIGDGENDMAMLQMVALGIAMGNAPPLVQAAADWVTATNNQDGIAMAIERLQAEGWLS
jgi:Cof subfamily protein (haloacid dehalogenase superfamily)